VISNRSGKTQYSSQRRTFLAALKLSNVRWVVTAFERQVFLRKTAPLARFAQNFTKAFFLRPGGGTTTAMPLHAQFNTDTIQTIVPETIVQIVGIGKEARSETLDSHVWRRRLNLPRFRHPVFANLRLLV
jgi:hypothetical protein